MTNVFLFHNKTLQMTFQSICPNRCIDQMNTINLFIFLLVHLFLCFPFYTGYKCYIHSAQIIAQWLWVFLIMHVARQSKHFIPKTTLIPKKKTKASPKRKCVDTSFALWQWIYKDMYLVFDYGRYMNENFMIWCNAVGVNLFINCHNYYKQRMKTKWISSFCWR